MIFELVKNSLRAVQERYMKSDKHAPPVRIIVADGAEDVTIKVWLYLRFPIAFFCWEVYSVKHGLEEFVCKFTTLQFPGTSSVYIKFPFVVLVDCCTGTHYKGNYKKPNSWAVIE